MPINCPNLTVDAVIRDKQKGIVLIKRANDPYKNHWALPGGFVEIGETVEQATIREALEETGLTIKLEKLLGVYSDPARDPRGHTVSVVFLAVPVEGSLRADTDAAEAEWFADPLVEDLAFDHREIIEAALKA